MTPDNAVAPDVGTGPWAVEHDEADGFYYLTLNGARDLSKSAYPIGKTAYRRARQLNETAEGVAVIKAILGPKPAITIPVDSPDHKAARKAIERSKKAPKPAPAAPKAETPAAPELSIFQGTREEWLNAFVAAARPVFKQHGHELPEKVRVSVGFMFRSPKAIGQCWHESASEDGTREIFINPSQADSARVADILTHELAHTLFGPDEKHGKNFKKAVTDLGLIGKATATEAGPEWHEWADPILAKLGTIPHAALNPLLSGIKKQSTRLLKCECEDCGFTFRATAKWVSNGEEGLRELRCPDVDCGGLVSVVLPGE